MYQVGRDPKGGRKGVGKVAGEEEAARVWGISREDKEVGHLDEISIFFQLWLHKGMKINWPPAQAAGPCAPSCFASYTKASIFREGP